MTRRRWGIILVIALMAAAGWQLAGQPFERLAAQLPGLRYSSATFGDYDNDGDLDVLFGPDVYRNDGGQGITAVTNLLAAWSDRTVTWQDVDQDGWLDAIVSGANEPVRILRSNGGASFSELAVLPPNSAGYSALLEWGDYDNDGDPDLLVAIHDTSTTVFRSDGAGIFYDIQAGLPRLFAPSMTWVDFDGDGDLDILLSGDAQGGLISRLYRNDGSHEFTDSGIALPGVRGASATWGDFDHDGDPDLLLSAGREGRMCRILRNDDALAFTEIEPGIQAYSATWGDFDNDGWLDVFSYGTPHLLHLNGGNSVFVEVNPAFPEISNGHAAVGDWDGDGDLDILLAGSAGSELWLNRSEFTNVAPEPPEGLSVDIASNRVAFSWSTASDAVQGGGLTYHVRVGTVPGGSDLAGSMVDATTGFRRIVRPGNAGQLHFWTLLNVPRGTYYWSVQAVDHSYIGSAFAPEHTFTVTTPTISTIPDQVIFPQSPPFVLGFSIQDLETPVSNLVLSVSSSNPQLVPTENVTVDGSGTNRTLTIGARSPFMGRALITIAVTDEHGLSAAESFAVEVVGFSVVRNSFPAGLHSFAAVWGDYDADLDLDFALYGYLDHGAGMQLMRNVGAGDFGLADVGILPISSSTLGPADQLAWGDFDNDGDLDVVASGEGPSEFGTLPYLNEDNGLLFEMEAGLPPDLRGSVSWGDFDQDGDLDLLLSGRLVFENDGHGRFTDSGILVSRPNFAASAIWLDVDNDGWLDIAYADRLLRNDGDRHFTPMGFGIPAFLDATAAWGDFDNDGDADLIVSGVENEVAYASRIYRNDGRGTFTDIGAGLPGVVGGSVAWVDFDNDGWLDVSLAGEGFQTSVYRNNGDGTFADVMAGLPGFAYRFYRGSMTWADYDNDGRTDLFLIGTAEQPLLRNNIATTNRPPAAPSGTSSFVDGNSVTLVWGVASDPNQTAGLSYNVRVGTTPGGMDILSPDSDPITGYRRVTRGGNASRRLSKTLRNLSIGTYYWSVQAVDHSFAGSPFADEASFDVAPGPPIITYGSPTGIAPSAATLVAYVHPRGSETLSHFDYGLSTNYGLVGAEVVLTDSATNLPVTETLSGLEIGRTYHYRLVASNANGQTLGADRTFQSPFFVPLPSGVPAGTFFTFADFDGDGWMDAVHQETGELLYNDHAGGLTRSSNQLPNTSGGALACLDYDGDNRVDVFVGTTGRLYRNLDGDTFVDSGIRLPALLNGFAAWGDYDNDGDQDVLLSGFKSATGLPITALYRNDGNGQFTDTETDLWQVTGNLQVQRGYGDWHDFDLDGDLDVLLCGGGATRMYRNNGQDFVDWEAGFAGVDVGAAAIGDFDNDGDPDIAVAGVPPYIKIAGHFLDGSVVRIYRNEGAGRFEPLLSTLHAPQQPLLAWGDYDNDGDLDLMASSHFGYYQTSFLYRNDDGIFERVPPIDLLASMLAWVDLDNDRDLDLFVNVPVIYRNVSVISNTPPTAPNGLQASVNGTEVVLRWDSGSDLNQAAGLTYNVRVGTVPGKGEILAAHSDPLSGQRQVPKPGNVGQSLTWKFKSLPGGTYHWSVQSVDHALAGSPFVHGAEFSVPYRPTLSQIADRGTLPDVTSRAIPFFISDVETSPEQLVLTGRSSNTNLVLDSAIVFAGSGTNRTVSITPQPGERGETVITVILTDAEGSKAFESFSLRVEEFTLFEFDSPKPVAPCAWGDYDSDGDLDLASFGSGRVVRNGGGWFEDSGLPPLPVVMGSFHWLDHDNDGDLDALVSEKMLFDNQAGTNFNTLEFGLPGYDGGTVVPGDFDQDGATDLVNIAGHLPGAGVEVITKLYRNQANGTFALVTTNLPPLRRGAASWVDYDSNGQIDLFLAEADPEALPFTRLYQYSASEGFVESPIELPDHADGSVVWGDYDNDGDLDLALASRSGESLFPAIYRQDPGSVFTRMDTDLPAGRSASLEWGDYDNDGDLDLLIAGHSDTADSVVSLMRNDGRDTFTDTGLGFGPGRSVAWADYDQDGDLDALIDGVRLYRNNNLLSNTAPEAPGNLTSAVAGNEAWLSWEAASDAQQTNGLSYNLRVGTSPAGVEVLSPLADVGTGRRRVVARGSADLSRTRILRGLEAGTYFWSVQAVDNAYEGSAFAEESTFVVEPPEVPFEITSMRLDENGRFAFRYATTIGRLYVVESSPDLRTWTGIQTNLAAEVSTVFAGPEAEPAAEQYYRVRRLP